MLRNGILAAFVLAAFMNAGCAGQPASREGDRTFFMDPPPTGTGIAPWSPRLGRDRPVIAVVGPNEGVEVTDFIVPHGILAASDVADVLAVATEPGPITMFPALTVQPDATIDEFDRAYPDGADYVIVPATHDPSHAVLNSWIRAQAARGATIVGVCDGVLVLAEAGLLEGRRATAHWYSMRNLERRHAQTRWIRDRRYVADANVVTTTGVSASVPVSLALVEAIAGWDRAEEVAASMGVADWSDEHDSDAYGVTAAHVVTWVGNLAAFWRRETLGIGITPGMNEVSLALIADAWARTSRSRVQTVAATTAPVRMQGGLRLVPDRSTQPGRMITTAGIDAGAALDTALAGIANSYGARTAAFVALQLEYPWSVSAAGER